MNILPKKRWHVRTKDNIARVRRDEALAAEEEKEIIRRAKLAEQEARTALLRRHANSGDSKTVEEPVDPEVSTADIYTEEGNINFFKELETGGGMCNGSTNKEHEQEQKEEKESYEKKIGLLTYLGQDTIESNKTKEWYNDQTKSVTSLLKEEEESFKESTVKGLKTKTALDPIHDILKYTKYEKKVQKSGVASRIDIDAPVEVKFPSSDKIEKLRKMLRKKDKLDKRKLGSNKKNKESKRKKSKKKHRRSDRESKQSRKRKADSSESDSDNHRRKKHRSSRSSNSGDEDERFEQKKTLEKMRAERLRREADERRRTQVFLAGNIKEPVDAPAPYQKYSSQFNPLFAKQNKNR